MDIKDEQFHLWHPVSIQDRRISEQMGGITFAQGH